MIKEYKKLSEISKMSLLSTDGEFTAVYKDNDTVIKVYNPKMLELEKKAGFNTERKILTARPIVELPELNIPISAIYDEKTRNFFASKSPYVEGKNYNEIYQRDTTDLTSLCNFHIRLENFLQRADKYNIVLPDYASLDNLIIDKNNNFHFIDYDEVQIKRNRSYDVSSSINTPLIDTPKYFNNADGFYTTELNIFSHVVVFFLNVLHANLLTIGEKINGETITFDTFFEFTGLDDYDIQHKVWKLFQQNQKNEYLGEDIVQISENYKLKIVDYHHNSFIQKKLVKK